MTTETRVNAAHLRLTQGNIAEVAADAIVNAANRGLAGGGGVDGAIHRAGGPSIMEECRRRGGCPTGSAVITGAGKLRARYVIHAVAPFYVDGMSGEAEQLRGAYATSLRLADEHKLSSIAFPALGTGAYRYPIRAAAEIALGTIIAHLQGETTLREVSMVLYSHADLEVHAEVLGRLLESPA
jgi:O-acetyl-ADP-ribose deacetylase (regulator of RNase III)